MPPVPRPRAPRSLPPALRALRHRNYRLFFFGQLISLIGTWMQTIAQSWLVYRLTGSSVALGAIGFASQVPVFLLAPVGGVVADRYPRRALIIATQSASMVLAFALGALTLTGAVAVWQVGVMAALLGIVNAIDVPTRQAFVLEMVDREDLVNAIALNSSLFNGARIIGPALAGILVAAVGEGWCFVANGVSYVAVIAGLAWMTPTPPRQRANVSALRHLLEGVRFIARTRPIRALLLLLGLTSLVAMPYTVLMPIFADRILHGGARGLGTLMGASGVGALVGAAALASRKGVLGLGRWIAIAAASFSLCLFAFALSQRFWLSVALMVPLGAAMIVQMAASNTLLQAMSPDALRGRVMSAYSMMFLGMAPFGALLAGLVARRVGAPATVAGGAIVCLCASLVFAVKRRGLSVAGRELVMAQMAGAGEPAAMILAATDEPPKPRQ